MTDETWDEATGMVLVAVLHLVGCGLPLFLLSGGSLAFLAPSWPVAVGIVAALGTIGLGWQLHRRGCGACPGPSRGSP